MGETNTNETPVPPGWVRLTDRGTKIIVRSGSIVSIEEAWSQAVKKYDSGGQYIGTGAGPSGEAEVFVVGRSEAIVVRESPAEVAALIAEAEAAERRARALPVLVAALLERREVDPWDKVQRIYNMNSALETAAAILDAIERREGE